MAKKDKSLGKLFGLSENGGYPIFFAGDGSVLDRQYGEFKVPVEYVGCSMGNGKGRSYEKEYLVNVSFIDLYNHLRLIGNDPNPRMGKYKKKEREEVLKTFCYMPEVTLDSNHGISIAALSAKITEENGQTYLSMFIGHKDATGLSGKEKQRIEEYNKRSGEYDGQNLAAMACQFVHTILEMPSDEAKEILNGVPLEDRYLRLSVKVYSEDFELTKLCRIVSAKNSGVPQDKTAVAMHLGCLKLLIPDELYDKDGIESKSNSEIYEMKQMKDTKESDMQYAVSYTRSKILPDDYCRDVGMIYEASKLGTKQKLMAFDEIPDKLKKGFLEGIVNDYKDVINCSRHKSTCVTRMLKPLNVFEGKLDEACVYNRVLNDAFLCNYYMNCFDLVNTFDYSNIDSSLLNILNIKESQKAMVSAWSGNVIRYEIPMLVMNFIPYIYGVMSSTKRGEDNEIMLTFEYDFKDFWASCGESIISIIADLRQLGIENSRDSFCLCTSTWHPCVEAWYKIRGIALNYMNSVKRKAA